MTVRRLADLARRRAYERSQKGMEQSIPTFRAAYLERLPGRASVEQIDALAKLPCDGHWFDEVDHILGVTLAGDILDEIITASPGSRRSV